MVCGSSSVSTVFGVSVRRALMGFLFFGLLGVCGGVRLPVSRRCMVLGFGEVCGVSCCGGVFCFGPEIRCVVW